MTSAAQVEKKQQEPIRAGPAATDDYAAILEASIKPLEIFKQNPKFYVRLKMNLEQESFYEAHQLFKTVHFRCSASELLWSDSLELIYFGVIYFGNRNQIYCAFDLAKVFIETLKQKTSTVEVDDKLADKIKEIHRSLHSGAEERSEFTAAILKWSQSLYSNRPSQITKSTIYRRDLADNAANYSLVYQKNFGNFLLQLKIAHNLWNEKFYAQARYHFLHSLDGRAFAKMVIEFQASYGYPSETDLFLAQSVLQLLCVRNLDSAQDFFDTYIASHPRLAGGDSAPSTSKSAEVAPLKGVFPQWPLINFINFLLHAVRRGNLGMFQKLKQIYRPSIDKDPTFHEYLDRVGQYFFGLKSANPEKGNMFSSLIKMLVSPDGPGDAGAADEDGSLDSLQRKISRQDNKLRNRNILDDDDEDECDHSCGEEEIDDTDLLD